MELIIDKLRKIEALAQSGIGGEKETAQRMIDALCKKYGITLDQIAEQVTKEYSFTIKNKWENILLETIVVHICQTKKVLNSRYGKKRYFFLTLLQSIDITDCYNHYRKSFSLEYEMLMDDMLTAFVHKHQLFGPKRDASENNENDVDMERARRIVSLMSLLKMNQWEGRKRIEA